MDEQARDFLADMLRIYSPSGKEAQLAGFLKDSMEQKLGFRNVRTDVVGDVMGEIGSGSPVVLLCGHMDTVPDKQQVKVNSGLLCGRGAVDAKGSLASMMLAASRLADQHCGKILVAAVVDEEGSGTGVKEVAKHLSGVDYAVFGEPSGIENITIGYKGRIMLRVTCRTSSVHASAPWMSVNAVEKGFEIWRIIKDYASKHEVQGDRYSSLTACLTEIRGGSAHNVLPGECEFTVDIRVPTRMSTKQTIGELEGVIKSFETDINFPKVDVKVEDVMEPFETDRRSILIRALSRAILETLNRKPMLVRKTGTGDMNHLGRVLKIPVVSYGPGNPHLSHTRKECLELPDYFASIEICKRAILNLNKFHNQQNSSLFPNV